MDNRDYIVVRDTDNIVIGESKLTGGQFLHYRSMATRPEGVIRLGAIPHEFYDLRDEFQDTHEDTLVFLAYDIFNE